MNKFNTYESLIADIIKSYPDRDIFVIDIKFHKVKKAFFKKCGFVSHNLVIGSDKERASRLKQLEADFLETNLSEFLGSLNFIPKQGHKYLLAVRQSTLNLYDKE